MRAPTRRPGRWPGWPKRVFDFVVASVGLIVLAPLLGVTALAIWLALGRPVIFAQRRPGRHGRPFILYKFRTMSNACGADGRLLPDHERRLTRLGRLLRRTSVDELPELINVIRGDMSLVGPRPLLMEYLPRYTREQARRHEVRPGITGWAQVNGRNTLPWERRFALDVWYVEHQSCRLDAGILLLTVWKALAQADVSEPGEAPDGWSTWPATLETATDVPAPDIEVAR
ncbi:MAG TPA: sugar transferase [Candidatus Limnocylindria bacterium]|nr:sugar transferase [Candidatus Limnocylindria bacterium]